MRPVEFAKNNIFCEKPVFKHAAMTKDGLAMGKKWCGGTLLPSPRHLLPSRTFKNRFFTKKNIIYTNYIFEVQTPFKDEFKF